MPTEVKWNAIWEWTWGPAGGLAAEARFGDNMVFDLMRLVVIVVGIVLAFLILRVLAEEARRKATNMPSTQKSRFVALLLFDLSVSVTEAWVMGTPATPRLIINFCALGFAVYGLWGIRRKQLSH